LKRLTALLVDDEPLAREKLRSLLTAHADIELVGEYADGSAALMHLERDRPDLLFLDIQMPGLDGFQVLEALAPEKIPQVIFVTAFDHYALRAFEVHALDYLLKPFDAARLQHALDHARRQLARPDGGLDRGVHDLLESLRRQRAYANEIVVKDRGRAEFVRVDDIDWIEAAGNYLEIHAAGKCHLLRETMKDLEARLDPDRFVRIHRSRLVHRQRVRQVEGGAFGEYRLTLENGIILTSGRGFGDRIRTWMKRPA
jgi:two-component system LytT family response regulator